MTVVTRLNSRNYDRVWEDRECDDTKVGWETCVERVEKFFLADDIDNDHKVPILLSLIGQENLHSAEGSYTWEASVKVLSTFNSYHSPEAFEPKALGNCGKISFLQEKPTWKRKHFVLCGRAKEDCDTLILVGIWTKGYEIGWSVDSEICRSKSDYCQKPKWSIPKLWRLL